MKDMDDILSMSAYFEKGKRIYEQDIEEGFEYREPPHLIVEIVNDATEMELYGPSYGYGDNSFHQAPTVTLFENKLLDEFLLYEIKKAKQGRLHTKGSVFIEEKKRLTNSKDTIIDGKLVSGQNNIYRYTFHDRYVDKKSAFLFSCQFFPQEEIRGIEVSRLFFILYKDSKEVNGSLDILVHREYLKRFSAGISIEQRMVLPYVYALEDPTSKQNTNTFKVEIKINKYNVGIIGRYLYESSLAEVFAKMPSEVKQTFELYCWTVHNPTFQLQETFPRLDGEITYALLEQTFLKKGWDLSYLNRDLIRLLGGNRSSAVGSFCVPEAGVANKYVFKITRDRKQALKEFTILRDAKRQKQLQYYLPALCLDEIPSEAEYYIILMEDMTDRELRKDEQREKCIREAKEKIFPDYHCWSDPHISDFYHRLYVANLFHSQLASLSDSLIFYENSSIQYWDAQQLIERLKPDLSMVGSIETLFSEFDSEIFAYLRERNTVKNCIVHNDMRDVNWVGRKKQFLIDYGNATRADLGGGVYRDIVRCVLGIEERGMMYFGECFIDALNFYLTLRGIDKTSEQLREEYALLFAELHVDAYRHILIACKTICKTDSRYDAMCTLDYAIQRSINFGRLAKEMVRKFIE